MKTYRLIKLIERVYKMSDVMYNCNHLSDWVGFGLDWDWDLDTRDWFIGFVIVQR